MDHKLYEVKIYGKDGTLKKKIGKRKLGKEYQKVYKQRMDEFAPAHLLRDGKGEQAPSTVLARTRQELDRNTCTVMVDGCQGGYGEHLVNRGGPRMGRLF